MGTVVKREALVVPTSPISFSHNYFLVKTCQFRAIALALFILFPCKLAWDRNVLWPLISIYLWLHSLLLKLSLLIKDSLLASHRGVTLFLLVKTILTWRLACYNQSNHAAITLLGYLVITVKIKLLQTTHSFSHGFSCSFPRPYSDGRGDTETVTLLL